MEHLTCSQFATQWLAVVTGPASGSRACFHVSLTLQDVSNCCFPALASNLLPSKGLALLSCQGFVSQIIRLQFLVIGMLSCWLAGRNNCPHYMEHQRCALGAGCKFRHPEPARDCGAVGAAREEAPPPCDGTAAPGR